MTAGGAVLQRLTARRVVAVVRGRSSAHLVTAADTLVGHGVDVIELTTNTPDAMAVLAGLVRRYPAACWGAGTVRTAEQVTAAAAAGARFAVAPNLDERVGAACAEAGLAWLPGAATPSEIVRAWDAGAAAVKVFPAASLGGPGFVREVRAPLDDIPLVPTGGVRLNEIGDYLAAGAVAVGLGGALLGDALDGGSLDELAERARQASAHSS